jgi:uncharacterized protein YjeT (DUF2065 family)
LSDLVVAIGIMLVVEGVLYGGFPSLAKRLAAEVSSMPDSRLRTGGMFAMAAGVVVVWLVRG